MKKICRLGQNRLRIQSENFIHPAHSRFLERVAGAPQTLAIMKESRD